MFIYGFTAALFLIGMWTHNEFFVILPGLVAWINALLREDFWKYRD